MQVIGDKEQISEDVSDFMISYLPFLQKSIRSELAKLFSHQYSINPFPNKLLFLHVCSTGLLKTLWEKEK